ncbi:MAG: hypothetical protein A2081_06455 [Elusimicrobia bacterium GWC2_61_19]|nr:MAG: hypothetical protein A2081_06455 [Elusimicrobia bacterium GWC2_61_19]
MKTIIMLLAALLALPAAAAALESDTEISGYLSAWTQDCAGASCALPVPGERNRPVLLRLALPAAPGEVSTVRVSRTLSLGEGLDLPVEITFYAVCPYGGAPGTCAGRYFQAQAVLSGPAGAFCASALNAADFFPFPVLMCAGTSAGGRRFGVTLHRQPL